MSRLRLELQAFRDGGPFEWGIAALMLLILAGDVAVLTIDAIRLAAL